jgi:hypothetical protein
MNKTTWNKFFHSRHFPLHIQSCSATSFHPIPFYFKMNPITFTLLLMGFVVAKSTNIPTGQSVDGFANWFPVHNDTSLDKRQDSDGRYRVILCTDFNEGGNCVNFGLLPDHRTGFRCCNKPFSRHNYFLQ